MTTVRDVVAALERHYPLRLAEPWDTGIGLTCGAEEDTVERILLAVDVDPATVEEAVYSGATMLVTHHPMLFRPVQSVAAGTDKGALLHRLIRAEIAHYAAHTNADRAVAGVSDALAHALGLVDLRPLVPAPAGLGSDPTREGLGRVGRLPGPMPLAAFAEHVARRLPATAGGVRAAGDPERVIEKVAVCGGSGGSELPAATRADVDVYVTSDISHHVAQEHVADRARPAIVDIAHWAGEWPWLEAARRVIADGCGAGVAIDISTRRTDAWTLHVPAR